MGFSAKQREFFDNANHRWNFKSGAVRSGKTYMDFFLIPKRIRARVGKPGLSVIMGVTQSTIKRNLLEPMAEIWGEDLVGDVKANNMCRLFGENVYILGAESVRQVSKLRGASVKYAYGDEVADWNKDVFELLKSRLDKPYSCFDGALNPQGPNHWLKAFLESDTDIYNQHYTIFDNPYLPKEFVDNLCREYEGTVYYKRYILGEWALAEGLIYPMYQEALAEPSEAASKGTIGRYVLSIDYGTQNAFCGLLWGLLDGVWYCLSEYYYSGRESGVQKTDGEYLAELDKWLEMWYATNGRPKPHELKTIIDPSAASFIALLKKTGFYLVTKADNDVADGIRETATALKTGKVKILRTCENFVRELGGYVWDEKKADDSPVKVNDHACDAARYFVKTMRVSVAETKYNSIFGR